MFCTHHDEGLGCIVNLLRPGKAGAPSCLMSVSPLPPLLYPARLCVCLCSHGLLRSGYNSLNTFPHTDKHLEYI